MKRKSIRGLVSLLLACAIGLMPGMASTARAAAPWQGSGTAADPYRISDLDGLIALRENFTTYYKSSFILTADIDCGEQDWIPIGSGFSQDKTYFWGTFDGDGHTITYNFNNPKGASGLFLRLYNEGSSTIKNLIVTGNVVTSGGGGIVAYHSYGLIENCVSNMNATVYSNVGYSGIAGAGYGTTRYCNFTGSIKAGAASVNNCGGITGIQDTELSKCACFGSIDRTGVDSYRTYFGLLTAHIRDGSVSNCYYMPSKQTSEGISTNGATEFTSQEQINAVKKEAEEAGMQVYADSLVAKSTVTFDGNGGTGTMPDELASGSYMLPKNAFTAPVGKVFAGWDVGDNHYKANESITINSDTTVKARWGEIGDSDVDVKVEQENMTTLPDTLAGTYSSLDDLKQKMFDALSASGRVPSQQSVQYLDVVLYVKPNGVDWERATLDNFPSGGIGVVVRLPYPSGTNKDNYLFYASHAFEYTDQRLGTTAGDIETSSVTCTDDGVEFKVNGLSPIVLGWWENTSYTVSFNTGGGSSVDSQTIENGKKVTKPTDPTKEGKLLDGWYGDQDLTTAWDFDQDGVTGNTTLYAKWTDKDAQTISASDMAVTFGDANKRVSATVTEPETGAGAISFAVKDGSTDYIDVDASTGVLTVKKVPTDGKAYVTVTAAETETCAKATKEVAVTIGKAAPTVTAPTAKAKTYNGQAQALIDAGSATGGETQYALGTDATTEPDAQLYSTSIPTATDVGTYYVWYRVVGDENHNGVDPKHVEVTIRKADISKAKVGLSKGNYVYNGSACTPVATVTLGGKVLEADADYKVSYASNVKPGAATVTATGTGNYTGTAKATFSIGLRSTKVKTVTHPSKGSIDVSWKAVEGAESYEVKWRAAGGKWKTMQAKGTSKTIKGLALGKSYELRVRAACGSVKAVWSDASFRWIRGVADIKAASTKSGTVKVSWKADAKATGGYEVFVRYQKNGKFVACTTVKAGRTSVTVKGLKGGRTAYVQVRPLVRRGGETYKGAINANPRKVKVK